MSENKEIDIKPRSREVTDGANICTRGIETTCSSKILEGWKPPYDAS